MKKAQDSAIATALASDDFVDHSVRTAEPGTASLFDVSMSTAPIRPSIGSAYRSAAHMMLPRWLRLLAVTPWSKQVLGVSRAKHDGTSQLLREQASALAIALLAELEPDRPDAAYLRECVRTSLIRWQLSLRGDGRPGSRASRRDPSHMAIAWYVVQLLTDSTGFLTGSLLDDVARHLHWLSQRRRKTPYLEAACVCTLADGALLIRDRRPLEQARSRLRTLLARQDEEGWFPERGGADIGRLSLTVDALARLYHQNEWPELFEPMRRAVRFLNHFVQPDGVAGGCYSSCGTGFISPYGVELLAAEVSEAADLARNCRQRFGRTGLRRILAWDDDLCAVLGAGIAQATTSASPVLSEVPREDRHIVRCRHFPNAGLSIFDSKAYHAVVNSRKGGAFRVVWRGVTAAFDDPGVIVVGQHSTLTSSRHHTCTQHRVTAESVTSKGILRRTRRTQDSLWTRIRRWLHGLARWTGEVDQPAGPAADRPDTGTLIHDLYRREILFDDDRLIIRDSVHCLRSPDAVVIQPTSTVHFGEMVDGPADSGITHLPISLNGGRYCELKRVYYRGRLEAQRETTDRRADAT